MIPAQLVEEVDQLRAQGYQIEVVEAEGWINVLLRAYPVPVGYSQSSTELLVKLPVSYPNGRPDMFWTDQELVLADGSIPKSADGVESALGKSRRRFSWHPQNWNPGTDSLLTYLEFINARLAKAL